MAIFSGIPFDLRRKLKNRQGVILVKKLLLMTLIMVIIFSSLPGFSASVNPEDMSKVPS